MTTLAVSVRRPRPRYLTPGTRIVLLVAALGAVVLILRFVRGLGATTNLSDAYPWGLWIAIDVACGVALAAGGFTTALAAHVLGRESLHPVVRPALLTAMLGYTFVALGVCTDLGRFWAIWHVMLPSMWQPNSVLFEVAVCVMTYLTVLYIEFLPVVCERLVGRIRLPRPLRALTGPLDRGLRALQGALGRTMTVFIVLGVVLSCMHQSSLGTLMVIADDRLHPLWQTPVLPLLFLLSAIGVGFPMVIFESLLASRSLGTPPEIDVLARLARTIPALLGVVLAARLVDLAVRGAFVHLLDATPTTAMFVLELGLGLVLPIAIFLDPRRRRTPRWLLAGSSLAILGVVLNRIDVFLVGYRPRDPSASYVPAWTEIAVTAGFVAAIVLLYRLLVLNLPVIESLPPAPRTETAS